MRRAALGGWSQRRWLTVGLLGAGSVAGVLALALPSSAGALAADASVHGPTLTVGDATGTVLGFTVKNTSRSEPIDAVEIRSPRASWTVRACPAGPAGWSRSVTASACRYRSASGAGGDLRPGASSSAFQLRVRTAPAASDQAGRWSVIVFRDASRASAPTAAARAFPSGLTSVAYTLKVTSVVVSATAPRPGTACPSATRRAKAGSTAVLVLCGRNASTAPARLVPSRASLTGSFASGGAYVPGSIRASSPVVVLGTWNHARVTSVVADGRTVSGRVGAASNRTSAPYRFAGFSSTDDAPVVSAVTAETTAGTAVQLRFRGTDADGDSIRFARVTAPAHGSLGVIGPAGCTGARPRSCIADVTYTPSAGYTGSDSFTYAASDGYRTSTPATVDITVRTGNQAPVANDDNLASSSDALLTADPRINDTDADGTALTISSLDVSGTKGTVTLRPDGRIDYDPRGAFPSLAPGTSTTDTFRYTVTDGSLVSLPATVTVTVTAPPSPPPPANQPPTAGADSGTTAEDTTLTVLAPGVLANDSDPEGGAVTAVGASAPAHGTVTVNTDGSYTYVPASNYSGTDSFTYQASDGVNSSAPATVTLTVTAVNDPPTTADQVDSTNEDTPKALTLAASDVDGDTLSYSVVTGPAHGSLGPIGTPSCAGTACTASVTYTPDLNYNGPDSVTFKANDGTVDSNTSTLALTVNPVNDAPVASGDSYSTNEDTTLSIGAPGVLSNDVDVEGSPLTAVLVAGPAHGSLTINPDGSFDYLPALNYSGLDSFTYKANDGAADSAATTVNLTVNGVNDAPTADLVSDSTNEDTPTSVTLSASDVDGDALTFAVVTGPTHGSLGAIAPPSCLAGVCTAAVTYTPALNDNGADSFTYKANDGTLDSNPATVTMTVDPVNDAPVANNDSYSTNEDTPLTVAAPGVLANDSDVEGTTLVGSNHTNASHGSVSFNDADGSFTYTPDSNYNGPDSFTYHANDGNLESAPATVSITVNPTNDPPTASPVPVSTSEDVAKVVTLSGVDSEGSNVTFSIVTGPTHGSLGPIGSPSCTTGCTASVTYTPDPNSNGTDSFTYKVNDGTSDSTPATVSLTIAAVNDAPSFLKGADEQVVVSSGPHTTTGWATAISPGPADEAGQTLTFSVVATDPTLFATQPAIDPASGDLTYTPGATLGSTNVSVSLSDSGGTASGGVDTGAAQTFTITVGPANATPTVDATSASGNEDGGAITVNLTGHDADDNDLTFTVGAATNGTVGSPTAADCTAVNVCTSTVTYTPNANFFGVDSFTYKVNDGTTDSANGTASITVNPVNDAPGFTMSTTSVTVLEDAPSGGISSLIASSSAGPANESGQVVSYEVVTNSNSGLFSTQPTISNAGDLTFVPAPDQNGSATLAIRAKDDGGTANGGVDVSPTQAFTVNVTAVNDAPSFVKGPDTTVNEDAGAQSFNPWATAISSGPGDESSQTVSFEITNISNSALFSAGAGQPAVSPTGTLTFTGAANRYGSSTVTLRIHDSGGTAGLGASDTSATQTFSITIDPVNDAPVATAKSFTVETNMKINLGGLLTGATDPNDVPVPAGQPAYTPTFTLSSVTSASCAGCVISNVDASAGTFDFETPPGGTGPYTLNYKVKDSGYPGTGTDSADALITITVSGPTIWFADAVNGDDTTGNGTLAHPFKTLAKVAAVDSAGDRVFLYPGGYSDPFTLTGNEWLTTSGTVGTTFDSLMGISPPAGTIARPSINGTKPTLSGAITLGSNNTLRGANLTGAPALTGTSFGTLTLGSTSSGTTDVSLNSTGRALNLDTGTISGDLVSTSSTGGTNNVNLNAVSSTTTSLGTGSLTGGTVDGLKINGGTGSFSYAGAVSNAGSGSTVLVTNKTGGTVALSGAVSDTAGAGVTLASNSGAIINLTGGVNLTSGTSSAFAATGGGTVTVTGAANTLASTTGTALTIANTTIGAADVTFRSINTNGAAKGIVLDTTGTSGNLAVTGDLSNLGACTAATPTCSGGTIANGTGSDDSGTSPGGTGIVLNSTSGVTLSHMYIHDHSNYGIRGHAVTGFNLDNSVVNGTNGGSGSSAVSAGGPFYEGSMLFDDLTGVVTFATDDVSGGLASNIEVHNTANTLTATFSAMKIGANSTSNGNDGIHVEGTGTSKVDATIQNSTFTSTRADQVQYIGDGSGGGSLTLSGNTLSDNHPGIATGGGGVTLSAGAAGPVTMTISNNTMRDAHGTAWEIVKSPGSGSLTGTFSGNTVGVAAVANSGSLEGSGIELLHGGTGLMSWTVQNNLIYQYNNFGINIQAGAGVVASGTMNTVITGNTVSNPGTNGTIGGIFQGVQVNSGITSGDSFTTCVDFGPNTINGSGRNTGPDFRLRQRMATTIRLPGYAADQDGAGVPAFVQGKIGGAPTGTAISDYPTTGGGFLGSACGP